MSHPLFVSPCQLLAEASSGSGRCPDPESESQDRASLVKWPAKLELGLSRLQAAKFSPQPNGAALGVAGKANRERGRVRVGSRTGGELVT
ncbi:hypothetical protein E4U37_000344 [Claviceps purpurea]|nr:hypothetical protein E4U37_000344 [Claviceps purpurea]